MQGSQELCSTAAPTPPLRDCADSLPEMCPARFPGPGALVPLAGDPALSHRSASDLPPALQSCQCLGAANLCPGGAPATRSLGHWCPAGYPGAREPRLVVVRAAGRGAGRSAGPHLPRAQEIAAVGTSIIIIAPFIEGPAETRRFLSPEVPHPPTVPPLPPPPPRRGQNPSAGRALADPPRSVRRGAASSPGPVCDETGDPGAAARGAAEAGAGLGGKLQRRQARGRPGLGVQGQPAALPGLALAPQARRALRGRSRRRRG